MYLMFQNSGEVEIPALHLIGASTKRNDSGKIGMFGSGFKYALAWVLRNNIPPRIFSGAQEIKISTIPREFRQQTFSVITINDEPTSLTTDLGPNWKLWQVIREIYANALDEGGCEHGQRPEPLGQPNTTRVFLPITPELEFILSNWGKYFLEPNLLSKQEAGEIHNGSGIFRYGIRVTEEESKLSPQFTYNFYDCSINEERIAGDWEILYQAARIWSYVTDSNLWRALFDVIKFPTTLEAQMACQNTGTLFAPDSWRCLESELDGKIANKEILAHLQIPLEPGMLMLPDVVYRTLERSGVKSWFAAKGFSSDGVELGPIPNHFKPALDQALAAIKPHDYIFPPNSIFFGKIRDPRMALSHTLFAKVQDGKVILFEPAFRDHATLCASLIEEWTHIKFNCADHSREMQTRYLHKIVELITGRKQNSAPILPHLVDNTEIPF